METATKILTYRDRRAASGLCVKCGEPSENYRCDECSAKHNQAYAKQRDTGFIRRPPRPGKLIDAVEARISDPITRGMVLALADAISATVWTQAAQIAQDFETMGHSEFTERYGDTSLREIFKSRLG